MKRQLKRFLLACWRGVPYRLKLIMSNVLSTLSGTREMRDFFNANQGDVERYQKLVQEKSDLEEYRVDKIIRTLGMELDALKDSNKQLRHELQEVKAALSLVPGRRLAHHNVARGVLRATNDDKDGKGA